MVLLPAVRPADPRVPEDLLDSCRVNCALSPVFSPADKKFRDFIALPAILDVVAAQDEVLDVLGFLAYECVRALCDAGVAHKKGVTEAKRQVADMERRREVRERKKRKREEVAEAEAEAEERRGLGEEADASENASAVDGPKADPSTPAAASTTTASPGGGGGRGGEARSPKKEQGTPSSSSRHHPSDGGAATTSDKPSSSSPRRKPLEVPTSLFSAPLPDAAASVPAFGGTDLVDGSSGSRAGAGDGVRTAGAGPTGELAPRVLFELEDVELGLHAVEHTYGSLKTSGMRNWRGGVSRIPTRLV